jgi:hypothetical protein
MDSASRCPQPHSHCDKSPQALNPESGADMKWLRLLVGLQVISRLDCFQVRGRLLLYRHGRCNDVCGRHISWIAGTPQSGLCEVLPWNWKTGRLSRAA